MKFNVRKGFVVAYTDRIKQGDKTVERSYTFYPEDGDVDLDKAHAIAHAHKLEGADKESKALLESLTSPVAAAPAVSGGIDVTALGTAIAQGLMAAQQQTMQQSSGVGGKQQAQQP
jgi:hypothetical protein